jgi:hypothetical protein
MIRRIYQQSRFWTFFIMLFLGMGITLNQIDAPTVFEDELFNEVNKNCTLKSADYPTGECVEAFVQLEEFNSESQMLYGKIYFEFPKRYGSNFPSSVQVNQPTYLTLDVASLDTNLPGSQDRWERYDMIGALDFSLSASNWEYEKRVSDSYFPFDNYSAEIGGNFAVQSEGVDTKATSDDVWETLPIQYTNYTRSVANYQFTFDYSYSIDKNKKDFDPNLDDSNLTLLIKVERPLLTQAIVFILGLLFLSGGVLLLFLLRAIRVKKRPAQLTGLVWGASTAFTMIQARSLFPGDPRNGVKLDLFVFYPLLSLCFISVILIFREWVRQEYTPREMPPLS